MRFISRDAPNRCVSMSQQPDIESLPREDRIILAIQALGFNKDLSNALLRSTTFIE